MSTKMYVGRAKPPANTATSRVFGVITIALEVDAASGEIVAADVIMQSQVVSRFLVGMIVGRRFPDDLAAIAEDIEDNYQSPLQRAVVQALFDAGKKHVSPATTTSGARTLRIADFSSGSDNSYLECGIRAAKQTATAYGLEVDVYDGRWNPATQAEQIQAALASGRYQAFIVEASDSSIVTPVLTDALADDSVSVVAINIPLGGRELNVGNTLWQPGTLTFVGGQTNDVYAEWMKCIVAMAQREYPNGGKAAAITGPKMGANGKNIDDAMRRLLPDTGIVLVANEETDYTAAEAYLKAQEILRAHPDLKLMISNYSGMTEGIVRAIREAGLREQVKVSDFGGSQWALDAVRRGDIQMSAVMLPYTETRRAVEAIVDHAQGKEVPKFIDLTKDPSLPGTILVTRENVDGFSAEYA